MKRFGRNQKRRAREAIARLEKEAVFQREYIEKLQRSRYDAARNFGKLRFVSSTFNGRTSAGMKEVPVFDRTEHEYDLVMPSIISDTYNKNLTYACVQIGPNGVMSSFAIDTDMLKQMPNVSLDEFSKYIAESFTTQLKELFASR